MPRFPKLNVLVAALAVCILLPSAAHAQQIVVPIALWRFEPTNFYGDSSGNGHTLVDGAGATVAVHSNAVVGPAGGTGSAQFDGTSVLRTTATLDLRGATHLRIRWIQRNLATVLVQPRFIFEQTANYTLTRGAFATAANSDLTGTTDPTTQGYVSLQGIGLISDLFPMNAGNPAGAWQQFTTDIDITPTSVTPITVTDANLTSIGTPVNIGGTPATFANDIFYIGARGNTAANGFIGNIDELEIDSIVTNGTGGGGGGNGGGTGGGTGTGTGVGGIVGGVLGGVFGSNGTSGANGVIIDADGVLRMKHFPDPGGALTKKRIAEARAHLNPQVAKASKLRKVSLNRLEAAVRARLEAGSPPTDEMQFLAGLTRLRYVFYYPDTKDIVLAGPAEPWAADLSGRVRGMDTGRPALELQDLVVALRAFAPGERPAPVILCSIDPTPEGLARMQQFLRGVGSQITPDDTEMIVDGLRTNLGMQNIRVGGVASNTHFAQVLLECDYRMKLIGIGLEKPPVRMVSYVDAAKPGGSRNALTRWYFIPDYNCVRLADDKLGLELVGDVVKLVTEDQIVGNDGTRAVSGKSNKASDVFTKNFTQKYSELAARVPVFAEMRNCIDLSIAAAFIHKQDFYRQSDWRAATFNDEHSLAVETNTTPLQVETVCTAVWKGNRLMTPVGGGVTIHPQQALQSKNVLPDRDGKVSEIRESIGLGQLPADQWWWD